jgi:ABC-type multidrug transport system ATPase subunit
VAFLSEQPYFYSHLKVSETLRFAAELLDLDKLVIKSEIDRVLALVNLTEKAGSRVKELSKGMQQRLNMAQALLGDPHTLILDEPMSGMDPPGRRLFRNLFSDLAQKGKTIFFSSHVLDDIEAVCDDVVVLSKGKLTFCGEIDEILDRGFLGTEINVSDLSPDDLLHLRSLNCEIRDLEKNSYQLFVPGKSDPGQIQNFLFSRSIKVDSISRRTMSLEDLLYGGSVESKDGRDNAEISASSELSELKT